MDFLVFAKIIFDPNFILFAKQLISYCLINVAQGFFLPCLLISFKCYAYSVLFPISSCPFILITSDRNEVRSCMNFVREDYNVFIFDKIDREFLGKSYDVNV